MNLVDMTLKQKVAQLLMVSFPGPKLSTTAERLMKLGVGHVIYYGDNAQSPNRLKKLSGGLQSRATIPLHIVVDQEGGRVVRFKGKGFTDLPSARCMADTGHKVERMARDKSQEMHAAGITMNLGPVADVDTNPDNPVIGDRSFGTEPGVVIRCCHQEIEAAHEQHIQTCIKHFPGHGDTTTDSHYALPTVNKSLEELEKSELPPFEALLSVTDAIMTAHVMYPNLDPDFCATLSPTILGGLRKRFQGLIISDSLTMEGVLAQTEGNIVKAAVKAFQAGCDVLCIPGLDPDGVVAVQKGLMHAVKAGRISRKRLDASVRRIQKSKAKI